MANIVNNCKNISIVRGNDTVLKLWLYTRELQEGASMRVPFAIEADDIFTVRLGGKYQSKTLRAERNGEEDNSLIVYLPWTTPTNSYGLEVEIKREGNHLRSFDCGRINIVECNAEASPTLERINTAWQAGMEVDMQIAFSAVTHGENAYELWRKLPGNENKTLQDFIDEVLNLNQNAAAARQAAQDADVAAGLANEKAQAAEMAAANAKADYVGEDNYVRRWNPVTQQYEKTDIYVKGNQGEAFTYNDFTPEQIAELQRPATEKAEELEAAEKLRKQAESARVTAENLRLQAESLRDQAETLRAQAESLRVQAETLRAQAESARVQAEQGRVQAETLRDSAETLRVQAESARVQAEQARVQTEALRVQAETARSNAEEARQVNETIRENNEQTRQSNTSTAISNAEAATSSANNAASNAEENAVLANTKAQLADQKAALADTAAQNANTKATLADQKATLANAAAQNANSAAEKIQTASFAVDAEMNLILLKSEQSTLNLEVTDGNLYEIKEQ